jgi:hypothetical protein
MQRINWRLAAAQSLDVRRYSAPQGGLLRATKVMCALLCCAVQAAAGGY